MPCMTMADMKPKQIIVELEPPPITRTGADMWWGMSEMSYYAAPRPQELFRSYGPFEGLGDNEIEVLNTLPAPLIEYLAEEAQDPAFVTAYLIPALNTPNPHKKIVDDITEAAVAYETGMGDLGKSFFKRIAKAVRKVHAKITPKFMRKIEGKVNKVVKKTWQKYGNVIIGVAGAVLAPFTGGASLAAASVIIAAKNMYDKRKAAIDAKKYAKKEAAQLNAEAAQQQSQVAAQVDQFYNDNQAWFLQYDMTPEKWAKLDLDHKIEFINAGAEGRLPASSKVVSLPPAQVDAQTANTISAAQSAGIPPSAVAPTGGGIPGAGYDTSAGGAPSPQDVTYGEAQKEASAPGAQFEAVVEGNSIGVYGSADEAFNAILAATHPGQRFEILANGKSLGMAVRTADGAVEVPPEAQAKMKDMSSEQSQKIVAEAEAEQKKEGGGFPWWLVLAGGAAVAAAS